MYLINLKNNSKNKVYKLLFIILLFLLIFNYFYNNNSNEVNIFIANEKYTFSKKDTSFEIDLETLNSEFNTIIEKEKKMSNIKVNGEKIFQKKDLGILDINEENKIVVEIKFKGDSKYTKYIINTLPKTMPKFNCIGESKTKGDFYFTTYGANFGESNMGTENFLIKINNNGKIIFYKKAGYNSFQFKKQIINNEIYYTYLNEDSSNGSDSLYVLDNKYNLVKKIKNIGNTDNKSIDSHDYLLIDLNNYIFADINNDGTEIISEIKNGKIVWESKWPSKEFEDIDKNGNKVMIKTQYHFNSFELDSDNNLLISFRHSDEIVKINRNNGKIIWTLGGEYNDFDKAIFSRQHSIVRMKDTYMVFSNNNKSITNDFISDGTKSSVAVFNLNQEKMKVENVKNYNLDCLSYQLGSVWPSDIENSIYVVDYGRSLDKGKKCFEEINLETGEVYFTFEYPDEESTIYRTYKY